MGDRQAQNVGTAAVRDDLRFDETRLAKWMAAHVYAFAGPLTVEQFKGGQSNPTFKLVTPTASYVMRRKPAGQLVTGAHAIDREHRVISALGGVDFPVPRTFGYCDDDDVIGSAFYIMELVQGRSIWDTRFPDVPDADRAAYFDAMNETIARLHTIDYKAIGLEDFGRAGGYLERQVRRWTRTYRDGIAIAGANADMDRLSAWLQAHIPRHQDTCLIHGDFRCDNMLFDPHEPKVVAVLDWELSTLGDPLADFAFHAMVYRLPPELITGLLGTDLVARNIPSEADHIATYCRRTGRSDIPDYSFYLAFNMFRLASIMHGIRQRALAGNASSGHAAEVGALYEPLAAYGWKTASAN